MMHAHVYGMYLRVYIHVYAYVYEYVYVYAYVRVTFSSANYRPGFRFGRHSALSRYRVGCVGRVSGTEVRYVCMYVFVCACMCVCVCLFVCMHVCACMHVFM